MMKRFSSISLSSKGASKGAVSKDYLSRAAKKTDFQRILDTWHNTANKNGSKVPKSVLKEFKKRISKAQSNGEEKAKLEFSNCSLDDKNIEHLMEGLAIRPVISKLDLSKNQITDEGVNTILKLLHAQLRLVKTVEMDQRANASFLCEVNLKDQAKPINPTLLENIEMLSSALKLVNAQAYIHEEFERQGAPIIITKKEVRSVWASTVGKVSEDAITAAFDGANLGHLKNSDDLEYEQFEEVLLQGLIAKDVLIPLNSRQMDKIAALEEKDTEEKKNDEDSKENSKKPKTLKEKKSLEDSFNEGFDKELSKREEKEKRKEERKNRKDEKTHEIIPTKSKRETSREPKEVSKEPSKEIPTVPSLDNEKTLMDMKNQSSSVRFIGNEEENSVKEEKVDESNNSMNSKRGQLQQSYSFLIELDGRDTPQSDEDSWLSPIGVQSNGYNAKSEDDPEDVAVILNSKATTPEKPKNQTVNTPTKNSSTDDNPIDSTAPKVSPIKNIHESPSINALFGSTPTIPVTANTDQQFISENNESMYSYGNKMPPPTPQYYSPQHYQQPPPNMGLGLETQQAIKTLLVKLSSRDLALNRIIASQGRQAKKKRLIPKNLPTKRKGRVWARREKILSKFNEEEAQRRLEEKQKQLYKQQKKLRDFSIDKLKIDAEDARAKYDFAESEVDRLIAHNNLFLRNISSYSEDDPGIKEYKSMSRSTTVPMPVLEHIVVDADNVSHGSLTSTASSSGLRRTYGMTPTDFAKGLEDGDDGGESTQSMSSIKTTSSLASNLRRANGFYPIELPSVPLQPDSTAASPEVVEQPEPKEQALTPKTDEDEAIPAIEKELADLDAKLNETDPFAYYSDGALRSRFVRILNGSNLSRLTVLNQANQFKKTIDFNEFLEPYQFPNLQVLVLRHNMFHSLETLQLSNLFNYLTDLDLGHNCLTGTISANQLPTSLLRLDLSHNKLTNIHGLMACVNLMELDLSYNSIKNFHALPAKLLRLDISHNMLSTSFSLRALGLSPEIKSIGLRGNPVVKEVYQWKTFVRSLLTKLVEIDGKPLPVTRQRERRSVSNHLHESTTLYAFTENAVRATSPSKREQEALDKERSEEYRQLLATREKKAKERDLLIEQEQKKISKNRVLDPLETKELTTRLYQPLQSKRSQSAERRRNTSNDTRGKKHDFNNNKEKPQYMIPTRSSEQKGAVAARNMTQGKKPGPRVKTPKIEEPIPESRALREWITKCSHELMIAAEVIDLSSKMARLGVTKANIYYFSQQLHRISFFYSQEIPFNVERVLSGLPPQDLLRRELSIIQEKMDRITLLLHQIENAIVHGPKGDFDLQESLDEVMSSDIGAFVNEHILRPFQREYKFITNTVRRTKSRSPPAYVSPTRAMRVAMSESRRKEDLRNSLGSGGRELTDNSPGTPSISPNPYDNYTGEFGSSEMNQESEQDELNTVKKRLQETTNHIESSKGGNPALGRVRNRLTMKALEGTLLADVDVDDELPQEKTTLAESIDMTTSNENKDVPSIAGSPHSEDENKRQEASPTALSLADEIQENSEVEEENKEEKEEDKAEEGLISRMSKPFNVICGSNDNDASTPKAAQLDIPDYFRDEDEDHEDHPGESESKDYDSFGNLPQMEKRESPLADATEEILELETATSPFEKPASEDPVESKPKFEVKTTAMDRLRARMAKKEADGEGPSRVENKSFLSETVIKVESRGPSPLRDSSPTNKDVILTSNIETKVDSEDRVKSELAEITVEKETPVTVPMEEKKTEEPFESYGNQTPVADFTTEKSDSTAAGTADEVVDVSKMSAKDRIKARMNKNKK